MPVPVASCVPHAAAVRPSWLAGLSAWWDLNEASGVRADRSGGNSPLTSNNSVGQASGILGNAASFTAASSMYLSRASNAALNMAGSSFTIAGWWYINDLAQRRTLFAKGNFGAVACEYAAYRETDNKIYFDVGNGTSKSETAGVSGMGSAAWKFILAQYDISNGQLAISINNGTAGTATLVGGTTAQGLAFNLGCNGNTTTFWDGRIGPVGLWNRLLTSGEKVALYNGGAGRFFP